MVRGGVCAVLEVCDGGSSLPGIAAADGCVLAGGQLFRAALRVTSRRRQSSRRDPAVRYAQGAGFGFEFEKVGQEGAFGEGMEVWGDVVVGRLNQGGEVGGGGVRQRCQHFGFAAEAMLDERP